MPYRKRVDEPHDVHRDRLVVSPAYSASLLSATPTGVQNHRQLLTRQNGQSVDCSTSLKLENIWHHERSMWGKYPRTRRDDNTIPNSVIGADGGTRTHDRLLRRQCDAPTPLMPVVTGCLRLSPHWLTACQNPAAPSLPRAIVTDCLRVWPLRLTAYEHSYTSPHLSSTQSERARASAAQANAIRCIPTAPGRGREPLLTVRAAIREAHI